MGRIALAASTASTESAARVTAVYSPEDVANQAVFVDGPDDPISMRDSAPLFDDDGRDYPDGHDAEGFVGGCKRMGCPGGTACSMYGGDPLDSRMMIDDDPDGPMEGGCF